MNKKRRHLVIKNYPLCDLNLIIVLYYNLIAISIRVRISRMFLFYWNKKHISQISRSKRSWLHLAALCYLLTAQNLGIFFPFGKSLYTYQSTYTILYGELKVAVGLDTDDTVVDMHSSFNRILKTQREYNEPNII